MNTSLNLSQNLSNPQPVVDQGPGMDPATIQEGTEKMSGYNAGMEKALSTFQEIVMVLFFTQLIQVVTHRLLYRDKPFAVTINHPISGEEIHSWGSDKQLEGRLRRYVQFIDQVSFTVGMAIAGFMFVQLYVPAYTWEVSTVWG